jgi:hypothetical protein
MLALTTRLSVAACVLLLVPALSHAHDPHAGDLWVAVSGEEQLKLSPLGFDPDHAVVVLEEGSIWYPGWSDDHPGFDAISTDDPEHDCYMLSSGAVIWLEIVDVDPAFIIWYGFTPLGPGDLQQLGSMPGGIHLHLNWNINNEHPDFDPLRVHWRATLRLVDTGSTGYADSEDFTMVFSNVECLSGDVNGDGLVNSFDIDPFVLVLTDPAAGTAEQRCAADANRDGVINVFDIDPFVELLTS